MTNDKEEQIIQDFQQQIDALTKDNHLVIQRERELADLLATALADAPIWNSDDPEYGEKRQAVLAKYAEMRKK